jgi:hypothetical protein
MSQPDLSFLATSDEKWALGIEVKAVSRKRVDDFRCLGGQLVLRAGPDFWLMTGESTDYLGSVHCLNNNWPDSFSSTLYCHPVYPDVVAGFPLAGDAWRVRLEPDIFRLVVQGDRVYVGTRRAYDGPGCLFAFDKEGTLAWRYDYMDVSKERGVQGMPYHLRVSERWGVVATAFMEYLYLFDAASGRLLWRIDIDHYRKELEFAGDLCAHPAVMQVLKEFLEQFLGVSLVNWIRFHPRKPLVFVKARSGDSVLVFDLAGRLVWLRRFVEHGEVYSPFDPHLAVFDQTGRFILLAGGEGIWKLLDEYGREMAAGRIPVPAAAVSIAPDASWLSAFRKEPNVLYLFSRTGQVLLEKPLASLRRIAALGDKLVILERQSQRLYIVEIVLEH